MTGLLLWSGASARRSSTLTLTCADIEQLASFPLALGWVEAPGSERVHRVFQLSNRLVVALYAAANYEPHLGPPADGFRGFTLGLNVASPDEVGADGNLTWA